MCVLTITLQRLTKRPVNPFGITGHNTGNNLLSHPSVGALPSAVAGLTSVFEMETCVSPHLWSPDWDPPLHAVIAKRTTSLEKFSSSS